tara:strand:+ start:298 stop:546 length:249 start_codon:yes stop_codon:yes gene_type:complete
LSKSLNKAKKLITETAIIIPGIAYPEIERLVIIFKNLLFKTRLPKLTKKEKKIISNDVKKIKKKVFKFNSIKFKFFAYSGNL